MAAPASHGVRGGERLPRGVAGERCGFGPERAAAGAARRHEMRCFLVEYPDRLARFGFPLSGPGWSPGVCGNGREARVRLLPAASQGANPRPKGAKAWSGGRVEDREIGLYTFQPGCQVAALGLDVGASHSRALLVGDDGRPWAAARAAGAAVGPGAPDPYPALRSLCAAILARALAGGHPAPDALRVVAGFAGAGHPERATRALGALAAALADAELGVASLRVCTDADIALAAVRPGEPDEPAAVLIAGTGSMALARGAAGEARAGGWGRYLGDPGGGAWLGAEGLVAVAEFLDGRRPGAEGLAAALMDQAGLTAARLSEAAAARWADPARLAALAPLVLGRAGFDPEAGRIVAAGAEGLAGLLRAARARAGTAPQALTGLAGGLWSASDGVLFQALAAALPSGWADRMVPLTLPPAAAAAALALDAAAARVLVEALVAVPPELV